MVQLKQKVTLKQKKEPISTPPPKQTKSNFLIPILILLGIVVLVGGYFLLKPGTSEGNRTGDLLIIDNIDSPSVPADIPTIVEGQNIVSKTEPGKDINDSRVSDSESNIPYNKGVAYKVYQFPFGSADYSKPNPELDKLVEVMKQNSGVKISIEAFTDKVGSVEFNKALSQKRAKAINDYIISKGIDASRLTHKGSGISTKYESDAENRRVEFIIN